MKDEKSWSQKIIHDANSGKNQISIWISKINVFQKLLIIQNIYLRTL